MQPSLEDKNSPSTDLLQEQQDTGLDDYEVGMKHPRDEAISAIVRRYKTHPFVLQAIQNQKTKYFTPRLSEHNVIHNFLGEAGTFARLSAEDVQELFGYIDQGYEIYQEIGGLNGLVKPQHEEAFIRLAAAQQVVYHTNLLLAFKMAKPYMRYQGAHLQAIDHVQEACAGLAFAISRFDVSQGYMFSTYATQWIRQRVTKAMADTSRTIRIPVQRHWQYIQSKQKIDEQGMLLGRSLTTQEIEETLGMSYAKYTELMRAGQPALPSLDQILPHSDDQELAAIVGYDHTNQDVENLSNREELKSIIESAELTERDKLIVGLRFGINPDIFGNPSVVIKGKTVSYKQLFENIVIDPESNTTHEEFMLEELGTVLGISRERVRQLQNKALLSLEAAAIRLGKSPGSSNG